jgi:hypothetical protein
MALKPEGLKKLLRSAIPARMPVLIKGTPGIGKTEITEQVCDELGYRLITEIASTSDPTDWKGLPATGGKYAEFKPFENLGEILEATEPTAWFFDDVAQCPEAVQNSIMHLFQKRCIGKYRIPDCVSLLAASNDKGQDAGVRGMTTAFKSRFKSIVELVPDVMAATDWLAAHGASAALVSYLRAVPDALSEFATGKGLTSFPCPRTWFALSQWENLKLDADIEEDTFKGAVGEVRATGYLTWRSMTFNRINLDAILKAPDTAAIPTAPDQLYAIAAGLSRRADVANFASIGKYVQRLIDAKHAEFGVLCVNDATNRDGKLRRTGTFATFQTGPLGKLFTGQ